MWLSTGAVLAMARLAYRYGVTQRELVENRLLAEDERVLATLSIDTPAWEYFARINSDGSIWRNAVRLDRYGVPSGAATV